MDCDRTVLSIVGEIVRGPYVDRCRGEIRWSDIAITNCEPGDWDGLVRSAFDGENKRCEIVSIHWGDKLIACCYPMFRGEVNQGRRAD